MRAVLLGCTALAALSLLLPSAPSFDPWAWIVWGREAWQLDLDTSGGPSWKPFPVVFTTLFAPFAAIHDGLPADLWLVVARAGALLSLVLAFRLTRRLGDGGRAGAGAGLVAAVALALVPQWVRYAAHGNEVPMAVAAMLWAIERHLDGRRDHALICGFVACLMRPEAFPLVAAYGLWLWRAEPSRRRLTVALAVALPACWLIPDWIGSGNPLSAPSKASSEPPWSLSLQEQPWLAALERADRIAGPVLEAGVAVAALFAALRRDRRTLGLVACALGWIALIAVMTELGFSGSTRYFAPAMVVGCVLTGLAALWAVRLAAPHGRAAAAATALALLLVAWPAVDERSDRFGRQWEASVEMVELQDELVEALRRSGGPGPVIAAGAPAVNRGLMPALAWETGLTLAEMEHATGEGFVFSTRGHPLWGASPALDGPVAASLRVGRWTVTQRSGAIGVPLPGSSSPSRGSDVTSLTSISSGSP